MVELHKLSNGITVLFETSSYYNSVAFGVWVNIGSKYENKENNGIAHLIEHMLFKGTKTRSANDISKETAFLGGNLNAYTSKEVTSFYARTLPEYLENCIDLVGDMLCNSVINEEELEREKGVICEEIDMYKDSPDDYVHEKIQKEIWKDHPLGFFISGKKKTVKSFTREQVLDFIEKNYVGEKMVISVAGKFCKEDTLKLIKKTFGHINKKGQKYKLTTPIYNSVNLKKHKDIEQLHMNIAFRGESVVDEDRYAFTVLNAILGGDVNSRLFQEVREKRGLTYSIYSYGSSFKEAGLFQIYAAMNPEQGKVVYDIIKSIMNDLVINGVTNEELEAAKHQIVVEMTLNRDSVVTKMNSNAKTYMSYGRIIPFRETINRIKKVNTNEIKRIIDNYIIMDQMSIGLVGPIEKNDEVW